MAMSTNSRLEQIIDEIYEFIERCKPQPLSQTKILVPKDEIYGLLDELRAYLPDEIKRYQKIITNRDTLIADADKKAEQIRNQAKEQAKRVVSEHEIYRQAYEQANAILQDADAYAKNLLREANEEAAQIRAGALEYTNSVLAEVEHALADAYESNRVKNENMIHTLKNNLDSLMSNRAEVYEQIKPEESQQETYRGDNFDFDENGY